MVLSCELLEPIIVAMRAIIVNVNAAGSVHNAAIPFAKGTTGDYAFCCEWANEFPAELQVNMARAKSATEGKSKSDIVREYLDSAPGASPSQIVADLKSYGVSQALAQKVKYLYGGGRRRPAKAASRAKPASSFPASEPAADQSKADSIRRVAGGMGKRLRPRDVVAALRDEGIAVSFAQVGNVLRSMGMRRRKGGSKRSAAASAGRVARSASSQTISLDALLAAKKLADQLGGVQVAKEAMDALAKLS
jgi:hypothetical protein